jgi:hypothetical protein
VTLIPTNGRSNLVYSTDDNRGVDLEAGLILTLDAPLNPMHTFRPKKKVQSTDGTDEPCGPFYRYRAL